ncbi:MAG: hypothetical protein OER22_05940 [Gammaproteobacteria bacterium]|nr:hypothetical protein [Gammaproteobacteria bacterium]MDH3552139.1 hypothetical protein [Gammaproteobacteria bacterium]
MTKQSCATRLCGISLLLLGLNIALVGCGKREVETKVRYEGTTAEFAAGVVASASQSLTDEEIVSGMSTAKLISGKDGLALIADWGDSYPVADARRIMELDDALAVTFSVPGNDADRFFLYVPLPAKASLPPGVDTCQTLGFDSGGVIAEGQGNCTCWDCQEVGGTDCCTQTCTSTPCGCPGVTSIFEGCVSDCRQEPDWTLDDLWTDPVPYQLEVVRQVFGTDDPRFLCDASVEGLMPGMGVFDLCSG